MPIQGIAFDLEGTIVDLERLHHAAHLQAARDVGVNLSWQEAIERIPHFIGGPDDAVASEIAFLAGNRVQPADVLALKQSYFKEIFNAQDHIAPRPGFREFATWVRQLGIPVAIGTVTTRELALVLLKQVDLLPMFDDLVIAREDVVAPKPAPDVYLRTARRIGIDPISQLVFEDSVVGIKAAAAAGCRSVAVPNVITPAYIQLLRSAGAEAIYETWEDPEMREYVKGEIDI